MRCANSWGLGPWEVQGSALLLFPGWAGVSEAGVSPAGSFHFPSHGQSPWDYFYSFCRGSRALPMLSLFHIGGPCGERESFQTRNLGSYDSFTALDPISLAHRTSDTTQAGQLQPLNQTLGLDRSPPIRADREAGYPVLLTYSEQRILQLCPTKRDFLTTRVDPPQAVNHLGLKTRRILPLEIGNLIQESQGLIGNIALCA